jgi:hypothetical protein
MKPWRIVMPNGYVVTPPPKRWLDGWDARSRIALGKPAVPALDSLPADVQVFVRRL